jgi:predicted nucleic acid-binding protein
MESRIGRMLITSKGFFEYYTTHYLKYELKKHNSKLLKLTKYSKSELEEAIEITTKKIRFINSSLVPEKTLRRAEKILTDIDLDDTEYLALSFHLNAKLWTGDIQLINGLKRKGIDITITTEELYSQFIHSQKK